VSLVISSYLDWMGRFARESHCCQPESGNPTFRDERGACGNVMHGLASLCHEAGNGGNNGRRCPKHARTVFLPDNCTSGLMREGRVKPVLYSTRRGLALSSSSISLIFHIGYLPSSTIDLSHPFNSNGQL
jgi:hypothetical protein